MKLILMRHMKSGWDGITSDHARPLNARGRAAAPLMGRWLSENGYLPNRAIISDARRTQETYEGISQHLPKALKPVFLRELYLAESVEISAILMAHNFAASDTVLIIGHNPGIAELAANLVADAPLHSKFYDYPTGATTILEITGKIVPLSGVLVDFVVPRDL